MDISRLARENELMKDYIHVNEILIDMILENRRAMLYRFALSAADRVMTKRK
jgi:hypothetical protein